jgi:SnoaL-like domain
MASKIDRSTPSTKQIVSLMYANLMGVFNERSPTARMATMKSIYALDFVFYEPTRSFKGNTEVDACVQALLDKFPTWVFRPAGPVSVNHNLGVLPWYFGPEGEEPVVEGTDIAVIEGGKMKSLHLLMEGDTEAEEFP